MTNTTAPANHYRFSHVARSEWIKLRSLRSTWGAMAVTLGGAVAIAAAVGVNTEDAAADLTNNALAGISLGLLVIGVLGVLVMTGEDASGLLGTTQPLPGAPAPLVGLAVLGLYAALALGAGGWLLARRDV
jgi:ABC-2 type transport system permease protein